MPRINRDYLDQFLHYNVDVATRTIYLGYGVAEDIDVDQTVASNIIKSLFILSSTRKEEPINMIINCQGGDTQHGLAIYDAIRMVQCPVHITVIGHCYSIAAWILQAGTVRRMTEHSSLMIHHGEGSKTAFDKEQDEKCSEILLSRIREKHPNYSEQKLDKLLLKDSYMWPQQALELGLIDEVVG